MRTLKRAKQNQRAAFLKVRKLIDGGWPNRKLTRLVELLAQDSAVGGTKS